MGPVAGCDCNACRAERERLPEYEKSAYVATELLQRYLTKTQKRILASDDYIPVKGSLGGKYRIFVNQEMVAKEVDREGDTYKRGVKFLKTYCVAPDTEEWLPSADVALCLMQHIRANEAYFLHKANPMRLRNAM